MKLWGKLGLLFSGCILLMVAWALYIFLFTPPAITQSIKMNDASKPFSLTLNAPSGKETVSSLDLKIEGKIDGKAVFYLSNQDSSFIKQYSSDNTDIQINYSGDWYTNSFDLKYIPSDSTDGNLSIIYTFY